MRLPTFWEAFWFLALFVSPVITGAVGVGLGYWLGLPTWAVAISPLFGWVALLGVIRALVRFDDKQRGRAEQSVAPDPTA
ncbi:hypothetical protein [Zavarzinella formosa]|uniref:hypothetical protein n=1 Tax=Zavarzinella formosa TaxID=360055 RepID=UPI00030A8178|nr:hypothetical protein [Zavarzinella formosa]